MDNTDNLDQLGTESVDDTPIEYTDNLAANIQSEFTDYKLKRVDQEQIWIRCIRNYNGVYGPEVQFEEHESDVFMKVTRTKVAAAISRIIQITNPAIGDAWAITPTPIAYELVAEQKGYPVEVVQKDATVRAEKMTKRIRDGLVEGNWRSKDLRGTLDMALFGTMVFKGPVAAPRRQKWVRTDGKYQKGSDPNDEYRPEIEWTSVWAFYPDPAAECIEDCNSAIIRHVMNRSQVRALRDMGGFRQDEVEAVLSEYPKGNWTSETWESEVDSALNQVNRPKQMGGRFVVLERWGALSGKELRQYGNEVPDEDLEKERIACVWVCGDHVLKAEISEFSDTQGRLPFYVTPYEQVPGKIWGRGVAEQMEDSQRIMNSCARAMVDSMAFSVAPQVVLDMNQLQKGGESDAFTPRKMWATRFTEASGNRKPVEFFTIPSNVPNILQAFGMAKDMIQEQTGLPDMITSGAPLESGLRTVGQMSMKLAAADALIKLTVSNIDSTRTEPMIRALYDWEMMYCPDDLIKGDFSVEARGVLGVMAKEVRSDRMNALLQQVNQDPEAKFWLKKDVLYQEIFTAMEMDGEAYVNTPEEAAKLRQEAAMEEMQKAEAQAQIQNMPKMEAQQPFPDAAIEVMKATKDTPQGPLAVKMAVQAQGVWNEEWDTATNMAQEQALAKYEAEMSAMKLQVQAAHVEVPPAGGMGQPDTGTPKAPPVENPPQPQQQMQGASGF